MSDQRSPRRVWASAAFLLALSVPAKVLAAPSKTFSGCERAFREAPRERSSSLCFYEVARAQGRWKEGASHLRRLRRAHPDVFWVPLHLAYIAAASPGPETIESLLREAAAGFARQGILAGELSARGNLRSLLVREGRSNEAEVEVLRIHEIGEQSDDPIVKSTAVISFAFHLAFHGRELRRAYRELRSVQSIALEHGSYWTKFRFFSTSAKLAAELGRLHEAEAAQVSLLQLTTEKKDNKGNRIRSGRSARNQGRPAAAAAARSRSSRRASLGRASRGVDRAIGRLPGSARPTQCGHPLSRPRTNA